MSKASLYEINSEIPSDVWNELRRRVEDGSLVPVEPAGTLTVTVVTDHGFDKWIDWGSHIPKLGRYAIVRLDDE